MVMETPSPECVGREFVLQYYTMLHEAPRYLHRFYSSASSYVHGGIGEDRPPAVGQAEIHKRIMELKFFKCHTKIRHVDSQATINNAVVVQVSGELSNNNEPMRRFMQTFVLAPQTPNKFYVHNDIFRYQDEIFCDSDTEDTNQEETTATEVINTEVYYEPEQPKPVEQPVPLSNGDAHYVEHVAPELPVPEIPRAAAAAVEPPQVSTVVPPVQAAPEPAEVIQQQEPEPKNKTWSAIASKKGNAAVSQPPVSSRPALPPAQRPAEPATQESHQSLPQRAPRAPRERPDAEKPANAPAETTTPAPEKKIPDSCQVFVGNLPTDIDQTALKEFFSTYGTVVEVKIHTSSASKIPYGFVAFTDEQPVRTILSEKRIEYKGHRLNVEEKKQKYFGGYNPRGRFPGQNYRGSSYRPHMSRGGGGGGYDGHPETSAATSNRAPAGLGAPKKVAA